MARLFTDSSSEHATYDGTPPVTAAPFTVACWARCTDSGSNVFPTAIGIGDKDVTNEQWYLQFEDFIGKRIKWVAQTSAGTAQANSPAGGWTVGQWYHVAGVEASSTSRFCYRDGSAGTENTTSRAPSGADRTSIGKVAESSPATQEYFAGDIAEVGIWNVALSAAEIASLAKGVTPPNIRPANLVFYAPLVGKHSPEVDLVGGLSLTLTGTSASAHPRVYRKRARVEAVPHFPNDTTVTPGTASLTTTKYAPSLKYTINAASPTALTLTPKTPTVSTASGTTVIPGVVSLTTALQAPSLKYTVNLATSSLTTTKYTPSLKYTINLATASLTLTGHPILINPIPGTATLSTTRFAPNLKLTVYPGNGTLNLTGNVPSIGYGFTPGTASLSTTRYAPSLQYGINLPAASSLVLSPKTPTAIATADVFGRVVNFNTVNTDPVGSIWFTVNATDPVGEVRFSVASVDPVGSIDFTVVATDPTGTLSFSVTGATVTFDEPEEI